MFNSATSSNQHKLPGFSLPLNFTPNQSGNASDKWGALFPSALEGENIRRLTPLREFEMMRFMNTVTDKSDWDKKVFDETIVAKWKVEALAEPDLDMTERMFSYCIGELRHKSRLFQETGAVTAYDGDVVKSDCAISSALKDALRIAVVPLEDVPIHRRDWHPGSNETVLDLVHPSLFPVVYGRTRILTESVVGLDDCIKRCGEGEILVVPPKVRAQSVVTRPGGDITDPFSRKFQWLPCEVKFNGDKIKIASYINNLHPQLHRPIYDVIEKIIGFTIPLWNQTLTPLQDGKHSIERIVYTDCVYDPDPEDLPEEEHPQQHPGESEDDYLERKDQWFKDVRQVTLPEPDTFVTPENGEIFDLKERFAERGLQIIVKLANIHLTPQKPEYEGGTWHVEGQLNEHICATGLYYYDNVNITESVLSFRQQTEYDVDVRYEQDHHDWLEEVFGCEQDGPALQYIGDVVTKEGRLLTFPNVFQHRVGPFSLVDKTKPGHRKILALFLVDPRIEIISSAHVPCQQKEWWKQELYATAVLPKLPPELLSEVVNGVEEFPIGLDEAKRLRLELMEERKKFISKHEDYLQSVTFSLCEH